VCRRRPQGGVSRTRSTNYVIRRPPHKHHHAPTPTTARVTALPELRIPRRSASVPSASTLTSDYASRHSPSTFTALLRNAPCCFPANACRRPASGPQHHAWAGLPGLLAGRGRGVQRVSGGPPFLESPALERNLGRGGAAARSSHKTNTKRRTRRDEHQETNREAHCRPDAGASPHRRPRANAAFAPAPPRSCGPMSSR
jgi:hypothetical protein